MNRFFYDNSLMVRLGRHFAFFTITVLAFAAILYAQNGNNGFFEILWLTLVNALFFFGYAYITLFLLIPEFLMNKKPFWFFLLFALVGIALSSIKLIVSDRIFYSAISPENIERNGVMNLRFIVVNTKDMTFIVALFCIAKYVKDYFYAEKMRKILEIQTKEAQRKLFQTQFDPHFMFNTINNLYALSLLNPQRTIETIARIKIVLNYIIEEIQKDFVELKQEIALVQNFAELEKLRYGNRLRVDFGVDDEIGHLPIPPMILFMLMENCLKHGSSLDAGKPWIKIEVRKKGDNIFLMAENSKPKTKVREKMEKKPRGQLQHLQKRLELIYSPHDFDLRIYEDERAFKVEIELITEIGKTQNTYR